VRPRGTGDHAQRQRGPRDRAARPGKDFDCDYYGTSLHKWLLAPIGTGFLYVKKDRIPGHWSLQPGAGSSIRKFEEIGTHPAANHNAIAEALTFHHGIGIERKAARLRYLKDRWAARLKGRPKFTLLTQLGPADSCAIGTIKINGVTAGELAARLWAERRILVAPITHPEFEGVRVTPNVYTTLDEIDVFADEMEENSHYVGTEVISLRATRPPVSRHARAARRR